jgi:hypothetical protein
MPAGRDGEGEGPVEIVDLGVNRPVPAVVAIDLHRGHLDPAVATMPLAADRAERVVAANARFWRAFGLRLER